MRERMATRAPQWLAILLVSLAGLLLEVGYTRIVSYKLYYYYVYLVIGLSLLGIGSGGILVAIWAPLRRATTERVIALCSLWGAVSVVVGYVVVARVPVDTVAIWDYGSYASFKNFGVLGLICFALFATFIALGIIVATLLGRAGERRVGRLYFADLLGAGLGCLLAIPLIVSLGPPTVVMLAALIFAVVGVIWMSRPSPGFIAGCVLVGVLAVAVAVESAVPDVRTEQRKFQGDSADSLYGDWGPVFRVDVHRVAPDAENRVLAHDGTYGSGIWKWDGDVSTLGRYEDDSRSIPFNLLGEPPGRELIIGSAGGQEILASLHFGAPRIEAIELNPVTVGLLEDEFADFTGRIPERPEVDLNQGDGRSYLERSDRSYDLVWYVAPDSYAANNAASSGAFVLSESYLYTTEMIENTLEHLRDDGMMVVQFGEFSFEEAPNRTSRYVVTAREALERFGVDDPRRHIIVAAEQTPNADLATIMVKRTPFTAAEVESFASDLPTVPNQVPIYAPGRSFDDRGVAGSALVASLASASAPEVDRIVADQPTEVQAITDDGPFFWHFRSFGDVLANITDPIEAIDPEDSIGERVLLLLLGIAVFYAALFLLLPFVAVRARWAALPSKGISAVYFACLGLGFMFFEITMIQRLVRFLGYPSYSLTVTLASILVSTGIGALLSRRFAGRSGTVVPIVLGLLAALTLFYQLALDPLTDALLSSGLAVRVVFALLVLAPLGLCLGMFMPLGLGLISRLTAHPEEYVAWSWAVNGFFSVIGSVLTTILSMSFGFRAVQYGGLAVYGLAVAAFLVLHRSADRAEPAPVPEPPPRQRRTAAVSG